MTSGLVSVVVASYNRAYVLRRAIESVLAQHHRHWELLVVDDGCDDETAALVEAYANRDPRIRFHQMEANCGEQSGPNNAGVQLARGDYIAFLNQDDWWFPDHLERALAFLHRKQADLVISGAFFPMPVDFVPRTLEDLERIQVAFQGIGLGYHWRPEMHCPASSWLLRRGIHQALGGWRCAATSTHPSQDFLFRAARAGHRIMPQPHASVICIASGMRPGSYTARRSPDHDYFLDFLAARENFRELLLERALYLQGNIAFQRKYWPRPRDVIAPLFKPPIYLLGWYLGLHPRHLQLRLRHALGGGFIAHLRRIRGLDPKP